MQTDQPLPTPPPPISTRSIKGDPATRKFGIFLLGTLAFITIGAIAGIVAGNISHYKYFSPYNATNISTSIIANNTIREMHIIVKKSRLWFPLTQRLKKLNR